MDEKNYQKKRNTSTGEKISKTIQDLPDYMMRFVTHMTTVKNASILTVYEYVRDISIIFQIIMEINPVIKSKKDITVTGKSIWMTILPGQENLLPSALCTNI